MNALEWGGYFDNAFLHHPYPKVAHHKAEKDLLAHNFVSSGRGEWASEWQASPAVRDAVKESHLSILKMVALQLGERED